MIQAKKLGGIIVPLVTPFDEHGDLAAEKAHVLIEKYLDIGVHGFYVGGTSGEGFFQSTDERCEFLRVVAEVVNGRGLLIAQVGALSERDVYALTGFAAENRYDVISSTPPFYFSHTDSEVMEYYRRLANVSDLPLLLYNIPGTTGRSISTNMQIEMLKLPNVVGSKHTDMNFFSAERLLREVPTAAIFNGPDEMLTGGLAMGMVGGIGSTYNLMPRIYLEIYNSVKLGDLSSARLLQATANDVIDELLRISPGVVPGIKYGLKVLGFDMGEARRPFLPLESDTTRYEELLIGANGL
ncbi:MAG: dihydrodipicolinate synthase family protein [Woeseiaceae bacterium]|nr:dihydrodipicolinate synthase family protein [Woeseiaceae bacterium]